MLHIKQENNDNGGLLLQSFSSPWAAEFMVMNFFVNHKQVRGEYSTLMNAVDPQPMMNVRLNLVEKGIVINVLFHQ